ncbi:hypothetical protein LY625_04425 [Lysobacter sp. GX 14042]|uniref:hypothetical protein n=1 Tax=Lysobacter sp. GX 14042 TaxID=2907155 RepID=UPI001F189D30|nr:hypothetical protein [Lysobacter sp. GX 14042]MCE7031868.1 hypothetical protein [Lysobacter sp. GX 14042]
MHACFRRVLPAAALVALLAACGRADEVPAQLPFLEPGVAFTVEPLAGASCDGGAYRAVARWEVPSSLTSKVEIQVSDQRQVFARSNDAAGAEETGQWTSDGMLFVLLDRETGMLLAALRAGPGPCNGG